MVCRLKLIYLAKIITATPPPQTHTHIQQTYILSSPYIPLLLFQLVPDNPLLATGTFTKTTGG